MTGTGRRLAVATCLPYRHLTKMAIDPSLAETDIFDEVLKYGLFLGAIFQLVCIGAVMFVPSRDDRRDGDSSDDDGSEHGSPHTSPPHRGHNQHHRRKQDKKKRR